MQAASDGERQAWVDYLSQCLVSSAVAYEGALGKLNDTFPRVRCPRLHARSRCVSPGLHVLACVT